MALASYEEERAYVTALPPIQAVPSLAQFADNGLGVAAFEENRMVGFLCCYSPFENAFSSTDAIGVFSPMGANAAIISNRNKIYSAMYQEAGKKWVKAKATSHSICLYAHDEELQRSFYRYGFGLRCIDAIRQMELIDCNVCTDYDFVELVKSEFNSVYPLDLALNYHFRASPFFMNRKPETQEEFMLSSEEEGARYFIAMQNEIVCAFLKISAEGETFVASGKSYCHVNGAFCLSEHRGKGVYQNLLNYVIKILKAEGYTRLGVDFESLNPTAYGFWLKYFTPYTNGVVRRIDEHILAVE